MSGTPHPRRSRQRKRKRISAGSNNWLLSSQQGKFWVPLHQLVHSERGECDSRRLRICVIFTQPLAFRWAYSASSWWGSCFCAPYFGARAADSPSQHFHRYTDADFRYHAHLELTTTTKKSNLSSALDSSPQLFDRSHRDCFIS